MPGFAAGLFVLFSCFAIVCGAALVRRSQTPSAPADRWAIAGGLLAVLAALRLAVASLGGTPQIADPLGGLFGLLLPAVVAWAVLAGPESRAFDRLLAALLAGCAILFAISVAAYPGAEAFPTSVFDQAWSVLALGLSVAAALAVVLRRPAMWPLFAGGLGLIAAGFVAHVAYLPSISAASPLLLAEAVSAPLIAFGAVAVLMRQIPVASIGLAASTRSSSSEAVLWLRLSEAETAPEFASRLTAAVGTWMRAEYSLLLTPPGSPAGLSIGAGYDLIHETPLAGAGLDPRTCPIISQALQAGRSVHLPPGTHSPDVPTLLRALGASGSAPALLVSLPAAGSTVAGLLLLSPHSQRSWGDETRLALETLAPSFGEQLQRRMTRSERELEAESLRDQLDLARRQLAELAAVRPPDEAPTAEWVGAADLHAQLEDAARTIETLEAEIERLRGALDRPPQPQGGEERLRAELGLALAALAEARAGPPAALAPPGPSRKSNGYARALEDARQPLTAIAGYTDLLLGESVGLLGANQRRFLERIRTAVERMEHSLAVLASRVPDAAAEAPPGAADVGAIVEQALEVLHDDLQSRGLAVRLDLPPQPILVPAEPALLQSIVADLLANAAGATPSGREIHVSLHADQEAGVAILAVTDRGRGVAADDLHRVFTASPWRETVRGLGLDGNRLARIKALTESIDGRAWVEREPNGGTTFFILLPSPAASA